MSRDWLLYLDDLIASAEKIARLIAGRDLSALRADEAAYDAVLFNLQIVGEAVKRLPADRREALPEGHRAGPARLRDLIAHRYFAIEPTIIWDVVTHHVPARRPTIRCATSRRSHGRAWSVERTRHGGRHSRASDRP